MPIVPLPQFEADLEADRKVYEALKTPKTLVVRFGVMKLVGEFPNDSGAKPGCGSKLVVRTHRGTEIGEMLTSTCPNSGCSKSVSRQQMLEYVENSGGRDYPFFQEGRVQRVATPEDLKRQEELEQSRHGIRLESRRVSEEMGIPIKIVDAETILGNERLFIYYYSEERVDLRDLGPRLARLFHNRVELRQVGARDEARITADYERCGQYCCCKNFLKVLKPISMKSAKIQKATLDPLKISGRCGRLMCCLRYEDETYETLRKRLPKKKQRVGTPEGDGFVVDTQILTQLVLVQLDETEPDGKIKQSAIPVENLSEPVSKTPPPPPVFGGPESQGRAGYSGPRDRRTEPDRGRPGGPRPARRDDRRPDRGPVPGAADVPGSPTAGRPQDRDRSAGRPRSERTGPGGPGPRDPRQASPGGPGDGASRDRPPKPRPPEEADDFGPDEIDELVGGEQEGPRESQSTPGEAQPGQQPSADGPRRRRRRRRRRGGGGPPAGGGDPS